MLDANKWLDTKFCGHIGAYLTFTLGCMGGHNGVTLT